MRILYIIISNRHTSSSSTKHLNETESKAGTIDPTDPDELLLSLTIELD